MEDDDIYAPTWKNLAQSPTLEPNLFQMTSKYKIKLKYGGYFRLAKNSARKRYCFGYKKCMSKLQVLSFMFTSNCRRCPFGQKLTGGVLNLSKSCMFCPLGQTWLEI
ncbi:hypothetical protein Hanom_Chr04g00358081 [Helianthus anomalus]